MVSPKALVATTFVFLVLITAAPLNLSLTPRSNEHDHSHGTVSIENLAKRSPDGTGSSPPAFSGGGGGRTVVFLVHEKKPNTGDPNLEPIKTPDAGPPPNKPSTGDPNLGPVKAPDAVPPPKKEEPPKPVTSKCSAPGNDHAEPESPYNGSPQGDPPPDEFAKMAVETHNRLREKHGACPLVWDNELAAKAAELSRGCGIKHVTDGFGQNLAWGYQDPADAIERAWYGHELENYKKKNGGVTGHFTALVWKNTKRVGCGWNPSCKTQFRNMYTCNYYPTGNFGGEYEANVQI